MYDIYTISSLAHYKAHVKLNVLIARWGEGGVFKRSVLCFFPKIRSNEEVDGAKEDCSLGKLAFDFVRMAKKPKTSNEMITPLMQRSGDAS